ESTISVASDPTTALHFDIVASCLPAGSVRQLESGFVERGVHLHLVDHDAQALRPSPGLDLDRAREANAARLAVVAECHVEGDLVPLHLPRGGRLDDEPALRLDPDASHPA